MMILFNFQQQALPLIAFFAVYCLGAAGCSYITYRLRRMRQKRGSR